MPDILEDFSQIPVEALQQPPEDGGEGVSPRAAAAAGPSQHYYPDGQAMTKSLAIFDIGSRSTIDARGEQQESLKHLSHLSGDSQVL